jgi:hypothetical protein
MNPKRASRVIAGIAILVVAIAATALPTGATVRHRPSNLPPLRSFAFVTTLEVRGTTPEQSIDVTSTGIYRRPGTQDCTTHMTLGPLEMSEHVRVVDSKIWVDDGDGWYRGTSDDYVGQVVCGSSPVFWRTMAVPTPAKGLGTRETIDGIQAERTEVSPSKAGGLAGVVAGGAPRAAVWRSLRHDILIGFEVSTSAASEAACHELLGMFSDAFTPSTCSTSMSFHMTRLNDDSIRIPNSAPSNRT